MKKLFFFLVSVLLLAYTTGAYAETVTYTVSSTSVATSGNAPTGSSISFAATYGTPVQMTGGNSQTYTLSGLSGVTITNIKLSMKSNSSKGAGSLTYSVNDGNSTTLATGKFNSNSWYGSWSTSYVDVNKDIIGVTNINGKIVFVINATESSLYCQSITITYTQSSQTGHTITYNCNGGSPCPNDMTNQTELPGTLPVLTKNGSTFDGWYKDANFTTAATAGEAITADVTLYAKWIENATTPTQLAAPTNLQVSNVTQSGATLSWDAVPNATKYEVVCTDAGAYTETLETTSASIDISGLNSSTMYLWTVKAVGNGTTYLDSEESTIADFTTQTPAATHTITWMNNGTQYEQNSATAGDKPTLPTAPNAPSGCSAKVFVGWSATNIGLTPDATAPADLFNTNADAPAITSNTTFYAVFADETTGTGGGGEISLETSFSNPSSDWVVNQSGGTSYWKIFGGNSILSPSFDLSTIRSITIQMGTFGAGTHSLNIKSSNGELWANEAPTSSSESKEYTIESDVVLSGNASLVFTSASSSTTAGIRVKSIKILCSTPSTTYSNYVTACDVCTEVVTPLTITPSATTLNLDANGCAVFSFSTADGNGGEVAYSVNGSPHDGPSFTATAAGSYTIVAEQAKTADDKCAQRATCTVEVTATPELTLTTAQPISLSAACGATASATMHVSGYNLTGNVTFESTDAAITFFPASIASTDGKVEADVTVRYTASLGGGAQSVDAQVTAKNGTESSNAIDITASKTGCSTVNVQISVQGTSTAIGGKYVGDAITSADIQGISTEACTGAVEYTFDGWATAEVVDGSTSYTKVTLPYTIEGDVTLYAVYRYTDVGAPSNRYTLVDDISDMESGVNYVIAAYANSTDKALKNVESSADAGKFESVLVTCDTDNTIVTDDSSIIWRVDGNATDGFTFYNAAISKYLDMKLESTRASLVLYDTPQYKYKVTISKDASGTKCTIKSTLSSNYNTFSFYNNLFNCYSRSSYNICFYKNSVACRFTTTPTCCAVVLSKPTVNAVPGDGEVQLQWSVAGQEAHIADYTVTCVEKNVTRTFTTTSATFTGLTNCTTYTFQVTANGSGTDVCSSPTAVATASPMANAVTVTFDYGVGSGTPAQWTSSCTEPTLTTLPTPTVPDGYTFVGWMNGTDVVTAPYAPTADVTLRAHYTKEPSVEIVEWDTASLLLELSTDDNVKVTLANEVHHGEESTSVANDLFISKYFEADGEAKVLAVFNGTNKKISLAGVKLCKDGAGFSLESFGHTEVGYIQPGEEFVFMRYGKAQSWAEKCATAEASFPTWYWCELNDVVYTDGSGDAKKTHGTVVGFNSTMSFSGRFTISLERNDTIIDLVGAVNGDGGSNYPEKTGVVYTEFTNQPSWGDDPGAFCMTGDNVRTAAVETDYGLSLNRCLLVRKNTVVDGSNAVASNKNGVFETLCSEWSGFQITKNDGAQDSTCTGLGYVAGFDYSNFYTTYETLVEQDFDATNRNPDGTVTLSVPGLAAQSCNKIRVEVFDAAQNRVAFTEQRVPIIVNEDATTATAKFFHFSTDTCKMCDVVVRDGKTLTKAADGTEGDRIEVRDLEVYAGSSLKVPTGTNYTVRQLTMRSKGDEVSMADVDGNLNLTSLAHTKRIDAARYYFFTLPYDCNVSSIVYRNGDALGTMGVDYLIKEYDGKGRAQGQNAGHWVTFTGTTLKAGKGYIIACDAPLNGTYDSNPKREFFFPLGATLAEATDKTVTVGTWGVGDATIGDNHKGWNLVGAPFMSNYSPIACAGLKLGTYENGEWNEEGTIFTYNDTVTVPYVTIPNADGKTYTQRLASAETMKPFRSFFVQVGKEGDVITYIAFPAAERRASAAPRVPAIDAVVNVELALKGASAEDVTTLIVDDSSSDAYEIGADLEKMLGLAALPQFYSVYSGSRLAFNALPSASAMSAVPLGYYAPVAGEYTISLAQLALPTVEGVYLTDNYTGSVTNLMLGDYSFSSSRTIDDSRFAVAIVRAVTSLDSREFTSDAVAYVDAQRTLQISNVDAGAEVQVIDALGRKVMVEQSCGTALRCQLPQAGVYMVRVVSASQESEYKVVSY